MSNNNSNNTIAGAAELFYMLESNKLADVEEIKKVFHDHFLYTKDNWLVNGLFDYYLSTNSLRVVEVLAGVREPHDKHLFDKLLDTLTKHDKNSRNRVLAITLLGHITRRQPTWLYKLTNHSLFKQILQLLKEEKETLPLMSALFLLVTLLPMLPTALTPHLQDIFEVFVRLAALHYQQSTYFSSTTNQHVGDKDQAFHLHLQIGLHNLFHRLYAMYPCNFVHFLNQRYSIRDNMPVFRNTIGPMLESVRMHPLLITTSKDAEISASRWKNKEHHDVVVECGRFALDRCKEETPSHNNSRFTPILDYSYTHTPTNKTPVLSIMNGDEDFWSPSKVVSPNSPPPLQAPNHDTRSTPSTPSNNRTRTSPPEAAIEATPETTPVKDLRQLSSRQLPANPSAVRALGAFSNGILSSSRPSTPSPMNSSSASISGDSIILSQKVNKIFADRQSIAQQTYRPVSDEYFKVFDSDNLSNGKNDLCLEDQEVSEIVNSQRPFKKDSEKSQKSIAALSKQVQQIQFYSKQETHDTNTQVNRAKSCPDIKLEKNINFSSKNFENSTLNTKKEDIAIQTCDGLPYEYLLFDLLDQKYAAETSSISNSESRLSPSSMLEHYIEISARTNSFSDKSRPNLSKQKLRKKSDDDIANGIGDEDNSEYNRLTQHIQLMQMQLQFERQRREVHAERNRRLLGKLRDSSELEELNATLRNQVKLAAAEIESLKNELLSTKKTTIVKEKKSLEDIKYWQKECEGKQQLISNLEAKIEVLEQELQIEKKKVIEGEKQARAAEATLFEAAHQLKEALKAANRSEDLKKHLDSVQKRFLLLGEAQSRISEKIDCIPHSKQESSLIQRAYSEEIINLRRQLDSQVLSVDSLKSKLSELENKDARKELLILDQQRLLQEAKEKHEAELGAVESKYKAQVEINLLLECKILELHGKLEIATFTASCSPAVNLASSVSPKERSPPLSGSLASSSEGSLAFVHSSTGIINNDYCDTGREIPNLQAIVSPETPQTVSAPNYVHYPEDKSPTKIFAKNNDKHSS